MNYVARDDFDGRKVRYVGDCLHAIMATGDARHTDESQTVRTAVLAAAGIRSSFDLCRELLPGASDLGIAHWQSSLGRHLLRGWGSVVMPVSAAHQVARPVSRKRSRPPVTARKRVSARQRLLQQILMSGDYLPMVDTRDTLVIVRPQHC